MLALSLGEFIGLLTFGFFFSKNKPILPSIGKSCIATILATILLRLIL